MGQIVGAIFVFVLIPLVVGHFTKQRDWDDYGD
jgi:ACR3 family arsenite efflux pump ArsB